MRNLGRWSGFCQEGPSGQERLAYRMAAKRAPASLKRGLVGRHVDVPSASPQVRPLRCPKVFQLWAGEQVEWPTVSQHAEKAGGKKDPRDPRGKSGQ